MPDQPMKPNAPRSRRRPGSSDSRRSRSESGPDAEGWLSGLHSVHEALRARRRRLLRLWLREGASSAELVAIAELARDIGIPIEAVDERDLERVCGEAVRSQGVALQAGPLPEDSLRALLEGAECPGSLGATRRIVVLDGVEDPQNLGAIARVAESAGCLGLVLAERRSPPLSPAVSRASAGAIEWLPVARVGNLSRGLEELKAAGFWVLAAALGGGSRSLYSLSDRVLTGDLAVVLGAEGRGIRPGVLEQADHRVEIPMRGRVASLNVGTAGAVILYELLRRAEFPTSSPGGERDRPA